MNTHWTALPKHDKPYPGLALGDDAWLKDRGKGRSVMFTFSDLVAVLRTTDEVVPIKKLFASKNYSTANA